MIEVPTCPTCGQVLRDDRVGIRMPRVKTRIFDAIRRAGPDGIYGDDLFDLCLRARNVQRETLKAHIYQLNELLVETKFVIRRHAGYYALERRVVPES